MQLAAEKRNRALAAAKLELEEAASVQRTLEAELAAAKAALRASDEARRVDQEQHTPCISLHDRSVREFIPCISLWDTPGDSLGLLTPLFFAWGPESFSLGPHGVLPICCPFNAAWQLQAAQSGGGRSRRRRNVRRRAKAAVAARAAPGFRRTRDQFF